MQKSNERQPLLRTMCVLASEAVDMGLPDSYIDSVLREIEANKEKYNPKNRKADWGSGNNRYATSLLGECNAVIYTMHLWKTEPPWVNIELLSERDDQYKRAIDVRVDGRTTIQVKTGHEYNGNVYVHVDWLKGQADDLVAVCNETRCFHEAPLALWKELYREHMSTPTKKSGGVWVMRETFVSRGGKITPFAAEIERIVE